MTSQLLQKICKKSAIISCVGGILIFLLYYFTASTNFGFYGFLYLLLACAINLVLFVLVFIKAFKDRQHQKGLLFTAGLMVLNIPIAIFILWFGGVLVNTMRITIVNSTAQDISNVEIEGCESRSIAIIKAGESINVWIKIPGECGIFMMYQSGITLKKEEIVGYLSRWSGGKVTHIVGTNDIRE